MAVTVTNIGRYVRLSGTISEVLTKLSDTGVQSGKVIYYSDDGTNAVLVYGNIR